jgi:hypothetical protein
MRYSSQEHYDSMITTAEMLGAGRSRDESVKVISRPLINENRSDERARSREQRVALAEMIARMFELWNLGWKDQLLILGLPETSRTALTRYRNGQPMVRSKDFLARCTNLLSIHESLRLLFPQNRELAYSWPAYRTTILETGHR